MTDNEICREYREAKNKKAQIQILADQMLCTRGEIIKILAENGEDVSQINTKAQVRRKKEEPVGFSTGSLFKKAAAPLLGADAARNC